LKTLITQEEQTLVSDIFKLLGKNQVMQAETKLKEVLTAKPEDAIAYSMLALCMIAREDDEAALLQAEKGVNLQPGTAFCHYVQASVFTELNILNRALISIREAIHLDPSDPLFHAQMASIYFTQRKWPDAVAAASRGLEYSPTDQNCRQIRRSALTAYEEQHGRSLVGRNTLMRITMNASLSADRGWVALSNDDIEGAKAHFSDALLLEMNLRSAQKGILLTISKRTPIYSLFLAVCAMLYRHWRVGVISSISVSIAAAVANICLGFAVPRLIWTIPGILAGLIFTLGRVLFPTLIYRWIYKYHSGITEIE
jgi:tetratricopeptide (TPR) repeat protein